MFRPFTVAAALAVAVGVCDPAGAQVLGYNNFTFVPLIAETPSYSSRIFVHNASPNDAEVFFSYTGATSSATPGKTVCTSLTIPAGNVVMTSLGELCSSLNPGSNFGALATFGFPIAIYTRAQTPSGKGFSVEGMIDITCCGGVREVVGLVRQAAPPGYQTNCFLLNQDTRAGRVVLTLATGDRQPIATQVIELQPGEFIRMLDVFATLGAAPGDYVNVRAIFESIVPVEGGSEVNFSASCTVQNNTSFDADFRIAKFHN
jgi:hypothetical protein